MTTPRVTVPVEPEYTATEYLRLIAEGWEVIESTGSQMTIQNPEDDGPQELVIDVDLLSAAPAPEGGAVRYRHKKRGTEYTLIGVGRAQGELQDEDPVVLYRGDDGGLWVRHQAEFCDGRFEEITALATREEAPAEAVEPKYFAAFMGESEALCAQPQAREEAQPVASAYRVRPEMNDPEEWTLMHPERAFDYLDRPGWETQPLYTHPAPDALRVALSDAMVEAACSRFVSESDDIWSDSVWPEGPDDDGDRGDGGRVRLISEADQHNIRSAMRFAMTDALAALQAEQKGGAA